MRGLASQLRVRAYLAGFAETIFFFVWIERYNRVPQRGTSSWPVHAWQSSVSTPSQWPGDEAVQIEAEPEENGLGDCPSAWNETDFLKGGPHGDPGRAPPVEM